jgi:hypothetical protein
MTPFDASEADHRTAMVAEHNRLADAINRAQAKAAKIGADGWREKPDPDVFWFSRIALACGALEAGDWAEAEALLEKHKDRFAQSRRQAGGDTTRANAERRHAAIKQALDMVAYRYARDRELYRLAKLFGCKTRTVETALSE